ncbi:MAG TPA: chromate transporter [Polyangiaceae bacterium]
MILLKLFWLFFRTSLVSFGGLYGALPELQRVFVVEHHFLSSEQLIQTYVIGQVVPGPNMVACTLIGLKIAGVPGALAASFGTYLAPILLICAVAKAFHRYYGVTWVRRVEVALRPLALGFMGAALITILRTELRAQAVVTVLVTATAGVLYARRVLGPMTLIAASGLAFALLSFGLRLI